MWPLVFLALMQDPSASPSAPTSQPTSVPASLLGPPRVEMLGIQEVRRRETLPTGEEKITLDLMMKFRMAGVRVAEVKRHGSIYITEANDDAGNSLIDPASLAAMETEVPRRAQFTMEGTTPTALDFQVVKIKAPARDAKSLPKLRGSIRVIYAPAFEGIYIDNPLQYQGKVIDHPRLKELGIEIAIMPAGDPAQFANSKRHVAFQVKKGGERVNEIKLCDAFLKEIRVKASPAKTLAGEECSVLMAAADLTSKETLVIEAYPSVEDVRFPIDFDGLKLP